MKEKWEYSIIHFIGDNERSIKRFRDEEEERLSQNNGEWVWTQRKDRAKRFFHEETAKSALIVNRFRGGKTRTISTKRSESGDHKEKTSWSEL